MIRRVAYLSMHTSPLLQPGQGDAGGMNVYVNELSEVIADRGVEVDVFTRRNSPDCPPVVEVKPGYRVHHIDAGPAQPVPITKLPKHVRQFAAGVLDSYARGGLPDLVHSHYWLSGWAGLMVKRALRVPLVNSFHTLGRVKDLTRRDDEAPESLLRIAAEHEVIEGSDCVTAATPVEAEDLLAHYGADPARLCTSPPGVDHTVFCPGDRVAARCRLGLPQGRIVLFAGRIQPLKGVDVAVEAFALVSRELPGSRLVIVGGPSGSRGETERKALLAAIHRHRLEDVVTWIPPVPHFALADYYRAADVLHMPSRSESFGLVAAEAQSCGLPVVAADVGGLRHVIDDGSTGLLVEGWDAPDHARALIKVLADPEMAGTMAQAAVKWSERFSWEATVDRFFELYEGAVGGGDGR